MGRHRAGTRNGHMRSASIGIVIVAALIVGGALPAMAGDDDASRASNAIAREFSKEGFPLERSEKRCLTRKLKKDHGLV